MPQKSTRRGSNKIDITGQRFGRLVVIREVEERFPGGVVAWECRCDCGNATKSRGVHLRGGRSQSCGCIRREITSEWCKIHKRKHGYSGTTIYRRWYGMTQRCTSPKNPRYKDYGGRGIKVCDAWLGSFETFLSDIGYPPGDGYTLERIDNDGNYKPGNVRWAKWAEQARNTRANKRITIDGVTRVLPEWLEHFDIPRPTYNSRVKRGMSCQEALTKPVDMNLSRGRTRLKAA